MTRKMQIIEKCFFKKNKEAQRERKYVHYSNLLHSLYGTDRKACLPDWKKDEDGVGEHIYIENNAKNIFFGSIHAMRTRTSERLP